LGVHSSDRLYGLCLPDMFQLTELTSREQLRSDMDRPLAIEV
jgi:hypothetical protein